MLHMYINVDLGEEIKADLAIEKAVMPHIQACNIACGGHAGTVDTIRETLLLARKYNVLCGAHPSYPDRENFGRIKLDISISKLRSSIEEQLTRYFKITDELDIDLHHIKMHGALYNESAKDETLAKLVIDIIKNLGRETILFAPPKSLLSELAISAALTIHHEVFGDRLYDDDLSLVSRTEAGSLITDPTILSSHIKPMLRQKLIPTRSGKALPVDMQTICMHSDHEGAIENIKFVAQEIKTNS